MKFVLYSLSLVSFSTLIGFAPSLGKPASAQCVMADVSVQAAITGSEAPSRQTNEVDMQSDGPCTGNTSVSTSRQIHVGGTDPVVQERRSRHRFTGGQDNGFGGGPTVKVPVGVQVDVYNPAEKYRNRR
jgi:hypothetical protein